MIFENNKICQKMQGKCIKKSKGRGGIDGKTLRRSHERINRKMRFTWSEPQSSEPGEGLDF